MDAGISARAAGGGFVVHDDGQFACAYRQGRIPADLEGLVRAACGRASVLLRNGVAIAKSGAADGYGGGWCACGRSAGSGGRGGVAAAAIPDTAATAGYQREAA